MDSRMSDFDPLATYDDGSCSPIRYGCSDPTAVNYRQAANMVACQHPSDGCTHSALALLSSCTHAGCMDSLALNFAPMATLPGRCIGAGIRHGCTEPSSVNYNSAFNADDGSCIFPGCSDPVRPNFNPTATHSSGCNFWREGCTDSRALNYNAANDLDDGSCSVPGCMDPTNSMFMVDATFDDGSCLSDRRRRQLLWWLDAGCMDPTAQSYNASATSHDGTTCTYVVVGCTDSTALNYSPDATVDALPSSCVSAIPGCTISSGTLNYDSWATVLEGCEYMYRGCTDSTSDAYLPIANVDDGSCTDDSHVTGCTDPDALNHDSLATITTDCSYAYAGCTDSLALNYDAQASLSIDEFLLGPGRGMTTLQRSYLRIDIACSYETVGCMAPMAQNYNPRATRDDGASCVLPLSGAVTAEAAAISGAALTGLIAIAAVLIGALSVTWLSRCLARRRLAVIRRECKTAALSFEYDDDPTLCAFSSMPMPATPWGTAGRIGSPGSADTSRWPATAQCSRWPASAETSRRHTEGIELTSRSPPVQTSSANKSPPKSGESSKSKPPVPPLNLMTPRSGARASQLHYLTTLEHEDAEGDDVPKELVSATPKSPNLTARSARSARSNAEVSNTARSATKKALVPPLNIGLAPCSGAFHPSQRPPSSHRTSRSARSALPASVEAFERPLSSYRATRSARARPPAPMEGADVNEHVIRGRREVLTPRSSSARQPKISPRGRHVWV